MQSSEKSELNAKHMSLLASTRWWQFGCGIPKTEKVCVCVYVCIIHTYIFKPEEWEEQKWTNHCEE